MPKRTTKTISPLNEILGDYTAPISDVSDSEVSDVLSEMSSTHSEDEEMSLDEADLTFDHDDDGESGEESFDIDDVLSCNEGLEPTEDDVKQDEQPSKLTAGQEASTTISPKEESQPSPSASTTTPKTVPRGRKRARSPSTPHTEPKAQSRLQLRTRSVSRSPQRSRSPPQTAALARSWKTEKDQDVCPSPRKFRPARTPGHQLDSAVSYTPLDLFRLFFNAEAAQLICNNTNKQAAKNIAKGKKYTWTELNIKEFYKYLGLTFFFSLLKLGPIQDYWKKNTIFSVSFPATVMPRDRYRVISWNLHMSDPEEDVENDKRKGTPYHDRLFRVKPLLDTIKNACKSFYHPRQNISIDEKMVAPKAHTGMTQYMKAKPIKWGFKLFVLADSSNGYTLDYSVYTGKSQAASGFGVGYDSVMSLINPAYLGSGFHLFVDNFYTSPKLFMKLFRLNIGACGTYRDTQSNVLTKKDPRGSIRWIRRNPLVFVKWMDTREVNVCSTIHSAFSGNTVQRRVKTGSGNWVTKPIPCPTSVIEYNKYMGGVDLSDQLIQYYSVHHKTMRWYKTLFYNFLDIAATNSYLLHKELCMEKGEQPMTHRGFLQELTAQLCDVTTTIPPAKTKSSHVPVAITEQTDKSKKASYGRKGCVLCRISRKAQQATPWKCKACGVALCVISDRNCFETWHS